MELELINDILTSTVSKLFMNPAKHLNYFKANEENYRSDIPKSSNRKENENLLSTQNLKTGEYNSQSAWKTTGRNKLEEAMRRLNIDDQRIKSKNLINFGIDFLLSEKAKVKAELKRYDTEFLDTFHRPPSRTEKEMMRPLYMYYKNLKNSIDQKQSSDGKAGSTGAYSRQSSNSSAKSNSSSSNKKVADISVVNLSNVANLGTINDHSSNISEINLNNVNLGTNKSFFKVDEKKHNSVINNMNMNSNNSSYNTVAIGKDGKDNTRKERSSSASSFFSVSSNNDSKANDVLSLDEKSNSSKKSHSVSKDKKLTRSEFNAYEKELDILLREQVELKQRLHAYQKEFYEVHNRRVKYYKDIIGIEFEYQKYKTNKTRIKEIEEILAPYKKR